jgi:chemotaxis protein MotB
MAHGGGDEGGENSERWLVSYADFITLLMVLFVVFYSMGQTDVAKYKALAEQMREAFTVGGGAQAIVVDAKINSSSGTVEDGSPKPIVVPGIPESPPKSEEVAGKLTQMLSQSGLGNEVSVQTNIEGVLISLSEKLTFKSGTVELAPEALPILQTISGMVVPISNQIRLVGHTDDTAPLDSRYATNWELSFARAKYIADILIKAGVDPKRVIVSGRGEYDPIFPNDTDEHRSLNGRVDIIIIYEVDNSIMETIK